VVIAVVPTVVALPAISPSRETPASAAPTSTTSTALPPNACGDYQCFYRAEDFLRSVPAPKPGQVATAPLRARAIGAPSGAPEMLVGLDNGPWSFWVAGDGFAQGRSGVIGSVSAGNVFNFVHWEYVDELYYYLHETVSVPPTQWVNAAHHNGVPVLGTVTPDCPVCGPEAAKLFTPATYEQTVRKLHDYAAAYGFDGWIIDIEGKDFVPSHTLLQAVKLLTGTRLPNGNAMRVVLYHGNEFSLGPLLPYVQAGAQWQSDYDRSTVWPAKTYQVLVSKNVHSAKGRAFWASYVYTYQGKCAAGSRTTAGQIWNGNQTSGKAAQCLDTRKLFTNQRAIVPLPGASNAPAFYTSVALFAPIWPFVGNLPDGAAPATRALVHAADDALWVGADVRYSGPACRRSGTDNAVSALVTPRSVLGDLPFVTNFNAGEGDVYAVEGTEVASAPWNNLSVQDVLPTWSCAIRGDLTAGTAYATAGTGDSFNGGSALRLSGRAGEIELFEAKIPISGSARVMLSFASKTRSGAPPYIRISYEDGTSDTMQATTNGPGWTETVHPLSAQGKTITAISVGVRGPKNDRVTAALGQLRLYDADAGPEPTPITVDSTDPVIAWTPAPDIASWNVYLSTPDCLHFLGPSFTNTYTVNQAMFGTSG
jgi:mannosyl-glycoprotein endo-beta-N-acetylglucosaminidase